MQRKEMWTLEVVLHIIFAIVATKQTGKSNIFMVPIGGSPPIAPTFQHLKNISRSVSLENPQRGHKRNRAAEVKGERQEQLGESSLNGLYDIVLVPDGYQMFVNKFLNRDLAQISTP